MSRYQGSSALAPTGALQASIKGKVQDAVLLGDQTITVVEACIKLHLLARIHCNASNGLSFLKIQFPAATHEIKALSEPNFHNGESVILHGYLGTRADLSRNLCFVPLLDKELRYSVQIVSAAKSSTGEIRPAHGILKVLEPNTPVVVRGLLKPRVPPTSKGPGDVQKIKTVEIELRAVQSLNDFPKDIIVTPDTEFPLEQRHLQIRSDEELRGALAFRASAANTCRDELINKYGFLEVETPLLFKSTPEGAREFIVPTRRKGLAYALPQSPQQFKQILMASGIPKYFQLAKCFRDEGMRADRQPEFTQLDLEVSFATGDNVMNCIEGLILRLWKDLLQITLSSPFPRMAYQEAMKRYGSDKPDIRLGTLISKVDYLLPADLVQKISPLTDPIVEAIRFRIDDDYDPTETRSFISKFMESPEATTFNENPEGGPGIFIHDSRKPLQGLQPLGFEAAEAIDKLFGAREGDLVVLQAREKAPFSGGSTKLGDLRLALHKEAVKQGLMQPPTGFAPLWITDFPLFSPSKSSEPGQGGRAGLASTHHPFTSPKSSDDVDLLLSDPSKVVGEHYDLVINGVELGGGSRRIHDAKVQEFIMKDILKMSPERLAEFSHLLEVLRAGCPPHAGIALGFDRLITVMLGKESVRDVIAFPKSGKGEDALTRSPGMMSEEVLETYHLRLRE
ncbi:aspartyl-trna synthetase [Lasallia pustulata]|uniref:Aspartyl-trna synthetase n=1 Tax=Lasallia pustulata TaxID=136370 RepID=A0A1W5CXH0_9LECA|nr:aspartyl-trna synthetase [Lasallia pustulata]